MYLLLRADWQISLLTDVLHSLHDGLLDATEHVKHVRYLQKDRQSLSDWVVLYPAHLHEGALPMSSHSDLFNAVTCLCASSTTLSCKPSQGRHTREPQSQETHCDLCAQKGCASPLAQTEVATKQFSQQTCKNISIDACNGGTQVQATSHSF